MKVSDIQNAVLAGKFSEADLLLINKIVITAVKAQRNLKTQVEKAAFRVGQRVTFRDRQNRLVEGKVTGFTGKRVKVTPNDSVGPGWLVPASMLEAV